MILLEQGEVVVMGVVDARFRNEGGGWRVRLLDENGIQLADRPWSLSTGLSEDALFYSLFHHERDRGLFRDPVQLRLGPEELAPLGPMPAAPWSTLRHPDHQCHVLDAGWTVIELTRPPTATRLSDRIHVEGASAFREDLRRGLGPRVLSEDERWQAGDVVVVEGRRTEDQVQELQVKGVAARVALLCWRSCRPPRLSIPQIHPTAHRSLSLTWLTQFLRFLLAGDRPEQAFARAGSSEPSTAHQDRWLTGHAGSWVPPDRDLKIPSDWYALLDRSQQERQLRDSIQGLTNAMTQRRIHVVVVNGPRNAGLDLFCERVSQNLPPQVRLVEGQVAWADDPSRQEHQLWRFAGALSRRELRGRLVAKVRELQRTTLFALTHEPCRLEGPQDMRRVSLADLGKYLSGLETVSADLTGTNIRILVLLAIATDHGDQVEALKCLRKVTPTFLVQVLTPLGVVPHAELESFLDSYSLPHEAEMLDRLSQLSYDELILTLATRYAGSL